MLGINMHRVVFLAFTRLWINETAQRERIVKRAERRALSYEDFEPYKTKQLIGFKQLHRVKVLARYPTAA